MADRTWNAVDSRLYEEMWSKEARLILGVIIARCPNPYGVYEIPYLILSTLFTNDEIQFGLDELVKEKAVSLYRDRRVVWIIKKWKRTGEPNLNQQKGAYNEVHGHFEEVWKDFAEMYKGLLRGFNPHSIPLPSESDTDPDSESDTDTEKKKRHKTVKSEPDLPGWCILLVTFLFPECNDINQQADALYKLERLDGYSHEVVTDVLTWARTDTGNGEWPGWSAQFQSCCQLRTKRDGVSKFAKMKGGYDNRKSKRKEITFG